MTRTREYKLNSMTTTNIGGKIKHVFYPKNIDQLADNLRNVYQNNLEFYIIGGGSNTIFGENFGENSCLINLSNFNTISKKSKLTKNKNTCFEIIEADTGATMQGIVDLGSRSHTNLFDRLNRIPGSIGGAVYGNAGAYGVEICELVENVEIINLNKFFELCKLSKTLSFISTSKILANCLEIFNAKECNFGYRTSLFKTSKHKFLITKIRLKSYKVVENKKIILLENSYYKIAKLRDANYPKNLKSPGSTFKNIELNNLSPKSNSSIDTDWIYNGRLPVAKLLNNCPDISESVNGIQMKNGHCNILVNHNDIKSLVLVNDVTRYLQKIKKYILDTYYIELEEEIRIVEKFNQINHI